MGYVTDEMKQALAEYKLARCVRGGELYHMGRSGDDCAMCVHVGAFAGRLCVTGFGLGAGGRGLICVPGYGIPWFASRKSEGYLCEKFLDREWQWDAAVEDMRWRIESDVADWEGWWMDHEVELVAFMSDPGWRYSEPTEAEYCESMREMGHDMDELPGYDYPREQAGWLCAVQQRFVELFATALATKSSLGTRAS